MLSDFREELTKNDQCQNISQKLVKLQFLNDKIDQNTKFAKLPRVKWLFLYKLTSYLQLLIFWLKLFLCQFLSCQKIWEDWKKI